MQSNHEIFRKHSHLHSLWNKIQGGGTFEDWTLEKIWLEHKGLITEMLRAGLKHLAPIDSLDSVEFLAKVDNSNQKLLSDHTNLHSLWNKIQQGEQLKDWTLEKIWLEHKGLITEMLRAGLKHLAPIDSLDSVEMLSKVNDDDQKLRSFHTELHSLWNKIQQGEQLKDWTLEKIWLEHKGLITEMLRGGLKHLAPIDSLDSIEFLSEITSKKKDLGKVNEINLIEASLEQLQIFHSLVHAEFAKIKKGFNLDVTLEDIWYFHASVKHEMITRGLKHLAPIDDLDRVEFLSAFAQPRPSNNGKGSWINLKEIINCFGDFKITEPFIYLVGGICNHGKTQGDIDILLNKEEPPDPDIDMPIKFRIMRMLPKKYWNRLHFLYAKNHGPFTNYVPLYSLEAKISSRQVMEMSNNIKAGSRLMINNALASEKEGKLNIFRFFTMMKPKHGVSENEIYNKENFMNKFDERLLPCHIDQKFDGMRAQIHSKGKIKKIFSDEGIDLTQRFPSAINELPAGNYILDSEITGKIAGKFIPRSDVAGYAHMKGEPKDEIFTFNLFDCLFFETDLHSKELDFRRNVLSNNFKNSKHIHIINFKIVRNLSELWSAINRILSLKESEGAMIKSISSVYELDGNTVNWIKYVKEWQIKARVLDKKTVSGTKSFNYLCVIDNNMPIGNTFNTDIDVKIGNSILVSFVNLNKYTDSDSKEVWFNWWRPRVIEKTSGVDSISTANKINKESRSLVEDKSYPLRYKKALELNSIFLENLEGVSISSTISPGVKSIIAAKHKKKKDLFYKEKMSLSCDFSKLDDSKVLSGHRAIHLMFQRISRGIDVRFNSNDLRTIHRNLATELLNRGFVHLNDHQELSEKFPENLCMRCGKCCFYKKKLDNGLLYFTNEHCKHLEFLEDGTTKCSVYASRKLIEHCLSIEEAIFLSCLPKECPYIKKVKNYAAPIDLNNKQMLSDNKPKSKKRFAIRHHYRGKSAHADIAFELDKNNVDAWVLDDLKKSEIDKPVLTVDSAKKEDKNFNNFKINYKTGDTDNRKILVQSKASESRAFTENISGVSPPGGAGATKTLPGVFSVLDSGTYETGARKPYFFEYFINGSIFKGRYIFRLLPRSGKWEETGKEGTVWFFWKTKDQNPYILSNRALKKQDFDIGKNSKSWLPSNLESKVPPELVWWGKDIDKEEFASRIKEVRKLFRKKNIIKLGSDFFVLHRKYWKGQEVIRKLPVESWSLSFSQGFRFKEIDKNPLKVKEDLNSLFEDIGEDSKWLKKSSFQIEAGEKGNPNKKIPAFVEFLDSGNFKILNEEPGKKLIRLISKRLSGIYSFSRVDPNSTQWVISKVGNEKDSLSIDQIEKIIRCSVVNELSRSEIAVSVCCAKSTVYKYQKIMDLI
jgi:uncharacterized cysteine cluster protein YcgN (CxxCxxCC family)